MRARLLRNRKLASSAASLLRGGVESALILGKIPCGRAVEWSARLCTAGWIVEVVLETISPLFAWSAARVLLYY